MLINLPLSSAQVLLVIGALRNSAQEHYSMASSPQDVHTLDGDTHTELANLIEELAITHIHA